MTLRGAPNANLNATILISPRGLTLYHLTAEHGKKIACTGQCLAFWPPLIVKKSAKLVAGRGLTAKKLGTIRRPDGRYQLTYAGLALYTFAADRRRGDVRGEGVENSWYAISPSGKLVKRPSTAG